MLCHRETALAGRRRCCIAGPLRNHRPMGAQCIGSGDCGAQLRNCVCRATALYNTYICQAQSPGWRCSATALIKSCAVAQACYCTPVWRWPRSEFVVSQRNYTCLSIGQQGFCLLLVEMCCFTDLPQTGSLLPQR